MRLFKSRAFALLLCCGVLVAGPAAAGLFDDEIARKQIADQQKRVEELRQQTDGRGRRQSTAGAGSGGRNRETA
jgi:hypothetical protein